MPPYHSLLLLWEIFHNQAFELFKLVNRLLVLVGCSSGSTYGGKHVGGIDRVLFQNLAPVSSVTILKSRLVWSFVIWAIRQRTHLLPRVPLANPQAYRRYT
jgi:hypothetical protein